jgi:hypothetical protein
MERRGHKIIGYSILQWELMIRISSRNYWGIDTLYQGDNPVPKTLNYNNLIQFLIGGTSEKNSKGFLINRVIELKAKWTCVIVSLCFTATGWVSDVKLTMLEPISEILQSGAKCDKEEWLATIIKRNYRECQENVWGIKFSSLLIWLAMSQFNLVREPTFT